MTFSSPIVISEKIQYKYPLVRGKAFAASLATHATLLVAIVYFISSHPIMPKPVEERIVISLSDFSSDQADPDKLEQTHPEPLKNPLPYKPQVSKPIQPSVVQPLHSPLSESVSTPEQNVPSPMSPSSEASAPLAPVRESVTASSQNVMHSPHLTAATVPPNSELPRQTVSTNDVGGAALGHIRALIENAITYPAIARKLRLEGVVLVSFTLLPDGTVTTANIDSTSGSRLLDTKAVQTILSLSGRYPALGKTFELSIPIRFSLTNS